MEKKAMELISLGAIAASGGISSLGQHFDAARKEGATDEEIKTAIGIGQLVAKRSMESINIILQRLFKEEPDISQAGEPLHSLEHLLMVQQKNYNPES